MKNLKKLIVITAMAALLICVAMTCAAADEKIYESPVFKLPVDRLQAEQWVENQPEETEAPAETDVVPGEEEQLPDQPTQAPDGETLLTLRMVSSMMWITGFESSLRNSSMKKWAVLQVTQR